MENLDIIILSTIVTTLFAVFIIGTYREFSKMSKEGFNPKPNEKKYGREALFVLASKLFEDETIPKKEKKKVVKAMYRTVADMESEGIYFPDEVKDELKKYREELHCEYSGLPSPKAYEVKNILK